MQHNFCDVYQHIFGDHKNFTKFDRSSLRYLHCFLLLNSDVEETFHLVFY